MPSALAVLGVCEDTGRDRELGVGEPMALAASKNTEGQFARMQFDQGFQTLITALRASDIARELVSGSSLAPHSVCDFGALVSLAVYRGRLRLCIRESISIVMARRWALSEALVESWL